MKYEYKLNVENVIRMAEEDKPISATIAKEAICILALENRILKGETGGRKPIGLLQSIDGNRSSIIIHD